MSSLRTLTQQAYGVLFPVLETLDISAPIARFLDLGGKSLLFGETGEEYVSGRMSPQRIEQESLESWRRAVALAKARAGELILAADADIAAVHRLQGLTSPLPDRQTAQRMSAAELEAVCYEMGRGVAATGVNLVLSPTADIVTGPNEWLAGRTLADDAEQAAQMVRAYVRGVRRSGLKATLKHFPGHPTCVGLPAKELAVVPASLQALRALWAPFRAGVDEGVDAVMMGPARYVAMEPVTAGSLSAELIGLLRSELGFRGLVMTCDLDHKATMGDAALGETAVAALVAGADLLLLSPKAVLRMDEVVDAIVNAIQHGSLGEDRLSSAYSKVCEQAERRSN